MFQIAAAKLRLFYELCKLFSIFLSFEPRFYAFIAFDAQNGESSVLKSLCHSEEHDPECSLGFGADGECHLGEGKDVAWHAEGEHDDACAERESLQPALDGEQELLHVGFVIFAGVGGHTR